MARREQFVSRHLRQVQSDSGSSTILCRIAQICGPGLQVRTDFPQLPYGRSVTPEVSNSDQLFLSKEAIVVVETSTSSPLFQVF